MDEALFVENVVSSPITEADQGLRRVPAGTPAGEGFVLRADVLARVEGAGHAYAAHEQLTDEDGFGTTAEEAVEDMVSSLGDRLHSLKRRESRLSPQDRSILERLECLLEPVGRLLAADRYCFPARCACASAW